MSLGLQREEDDDEGRICCCGGSASWCDVCADETGVIRRRRGEGWRKGGREF